MPQACSHQAAPEQPPVLAALPRQDGCWRLGMAREQHDLLTGAGYASQVTRPNACRHHCRAGPQAQEAVLLAFLWAASAAVGMFLLPSRLDRQLGAQAAGRCCLAQPLGACTCGLAGCHGLGPACWRQGGLQALLTGGPVTQVVWDLET